jgi:ligand-binding sensor domain-containing protein
VNAIAIDGANRKWFGTEKSGAFLMSSDGTKQVSHFTEEESPILANTISSIAIDADGEVFFGTSKGIVSYKGTAASPDNDTTKVYAYPNPVREGFNGSITIDGLADNSDVKITDIAGNLVYSTKANGSRAIWKGKNFDGGRAHSGVYLVFASDKNGSKTLVTKILVIK